LSKICTCNELAESVSVPFDAKISGCRARSYLSRCWKSILIQASSSREEATHVRNLSASTSSALSHELLARCLHVEYPQREPVSVCGVFCSRTAGRSTTCRCREATHGLPQRCQVDPPHVSSGQSIHLGSQTCHDRDNSSTLASSEKDQNISRWRSSGKGASSMSD
jgi:hypothetical protein